MSAHACFAHTRVCVYEYMRAGARARVCMNIMHDYMYVCCYACKHSCDRLCKCVSTHARDAAHMHALAYAHIDVFYPSS